MRMGKHVKKRRSRSKQTPGPKVPSRMSRATVVGQVSPNVVASVLWPELFARAENSVERYAEKHAEYEEEVRRLREEAAASKKKGADAVGGDGDDQEGEEDMDAELDLDEAEIDADGTVTAAAAGGGEDEGDDDILLPPPPGRNVLFASQYSVDEFVSQVLQPTSRHFAQSNEWKVHANAAKFERLLDEKYGRFRPFIEQHPEVEQFVRNLQRRWAKGHFSPFRQGDPPMSRSTSVIVLFMMQRNAVRWEAMLLVAVFLLVGLQPWALVTIVAFAHNRLQNRKRRRVGGFADELTILDPYYGDGDGEDVDAAAERSDPELEKRRRNDLLRTPVGEPLAATDFAKKDGGDEDEEETYDAIVLGSGPDALYSAALLSRTGRSVLVLSGEADASGCHTLSEKTVAGPKTEKRWSDVPFDARPSNVSHVLRQQRLLSPAVCTTTDAQGGVRFARIGSEADGFAHTVLSIPGVGVDSGADDGVPFVLRAGGVRALAEDAAQCLGDGWPGEDGKVGNSSSALYASACKLVNGSASEYYMSRILHDSVYALRSKKSYPEAGIRHASAFLNKLLPLNAHVRSLMAGIGMKDENLPPGRSSQAPHVTNVCASVVGEEGLCYPVGGPRAVCKALEAAIVQCGGRVVTAAPLERLIFEEEKDGAAAKKKAAKKKKKKGDGDAKDGEAEVGADDKADKPRCVGVALADGRTVKVKAETGAVVSHVGFIPTFIRLVPEDVRDEHGVPRGLPALTERRPLMQVLVGLRGTSDELDVTGADYYRLPNARIARDEVDEVTGQVKLGEIGSDGQAPATEDDAEKEKEGEKKDIDATSAPSEEVGGGNHRGKRSRGGGGGGGGRKQRFDRGVSWMRVSFPSAKDPSWHERHPDVTTCVVTVEADDDFVTCFETKPKVFSIHSGKQSGGDATRLVEKVMKDVLDIFPQLEGKVECAELRGPYRAGLSQGPERYAAKGVRADSPYPGLFIGGSELTVGDSYSGAMVGAWLAANAVVGYSFIDHLYLVKNITTDLEQFLDEPSSDGTEEDDVAVPYTPKVLPNPPVAELEDKPEGGEETTAESSKEK